MGLRAFLADVLAYLEFAQPLDNEGADEQADKQRREGCKDATKREIAEDAEDAKVGEKLLVKQPIEQGRSA